MQVEIALLGVATQEQHVRCYRAREGGGGGGGGAAGGKDTVHWYIYRYTCA